jgi:hypothetical protein
MFDHVIYREEKYKSCDVLHLALVTIFMFVFAPRLGLRFASEQRHQGCRNSRTVLDTA